jgi:hypothetical protein
MVWEFPAISQSRREFWGEPQYTRFGMWIFTLLFGFWGLHHFMLRSPQTAILCCLVNIFTFGYWYFYDLIQLSSEEFGGLGDDGLNKYGLASPWGPLGIAQGMWIAPPKLEKQTGGNQNIKPEKQVKGGMAQAAGNFAMHGLGLVLDWFTSVRPIMPKVMDTPGQKDPWYFFLYCLTIPTGVVSALFAGDKTNAFFRLTLFLLLPILIFVILYDIFVLLLFPSSAVFDGISRPFPYSIFNSIDLNGRSPLITCTKENPTDPKALEKLFQTYVSLFQEGAALTEAGLAYVPAAAPGALVQQGKELMDVYIQKAKHDMAKETVQTGGGQSSMIHGLAGITAAAVIGGGLFLAASRSYVKGKDDEPPNTGTI